jgi:hypothetical protein
MVRVVEHKDQQTTKANGLSLLELCEAIHKNLRAHGYSTDDDIAEILSYVRVFYERYNNNLQRVMVPGGSVEKAEAAWNGTTPLSEEFGDD